MKSCFLKTALEPEMADIFKTPPDVRIGSEDNFRYYSPQSSNSFTTMKRKRSSKNVEYKGDKRRRRTAEDFLMFCKIILDHENYEQQRSQDLRLRHSSSPLGSTGSSNESWPLSKDEYSEMYSPPHHNVNLDIEDEVNNSNSTEEERENSEDADDSWDQVTCYCGKPFAGRPMIECSKCLTWVHLKCAGLRRTNIPDTWHCTKCKPKPTSLNKSDQDQNQHEKPVSGSRKRKSTKQVHSTSVAVAVAKADAASRDRTLVSMASKTASPTSASATGTTSPTSAVAISKKIDVESFDES